MRAVVCCTERGDQMSTLSSSLLISTLQTRNSCAASWLKAYVYTLFQTKLPHDEMDKGGQT